MKLITFQLQDDIFGIEATYVYRILDDVRITPVCLMPDFYLGLLYYRGELFDVIELGVLMGQEASAGSAQRLMVIRWDDRKLALLPGNILGLMWVEDHDRQEALIAEDGRTIHLMSPRQIWERIVRRLTAFQAGRREPGESVKGS